MKHVLIGIMLIVVIMAQEEFFIPGSTVGGYGELHYNRSQSGENAAATKLDFHRFIMYFGYAFSEQWSFKSELELEHNYVSDGDGELELEQAFINYHTSGFGFQAGVILPSVGLVNEYHEPPLFVSVERPDYSKDVIPTTWFGNGAAIYGKIKEINWRIAILEDLNGDKVGKGIRNARVKGFESTAYDLVKNFSLNYTALPGLRIGGSFTFNNAPTSDYFITDNDGNIVINESDTASVGIQLAEFHTQYDANNIYAVFEYGQINYKNNPLGYSSSGGYYFDLGYNISNIINLEGKLLPWIRISNYNRGNDDDTVNYFIQRLGVSYWPLSNIVFKTEYGLKKTAADEEPTKQINIGIGYNF